MQLAKDELSKGFSMFLVFFIQGRKKIPSFPSVPKIGLDFSLDTGRQVDFGQPGGFTFSVELWWGLTPDFSSSVH